MEKWGGGVRLSCDGRRRLWVSCECGCTREVPRCCDERLTVTVHHIRLTVYALIAAVLAVFFQVMVFVADAMVDMGVPEAVVNSPAGTAFLERVGKPVYETLRVLCLNRARQRTSLESQMLVRS